MRFHHLIRWDMRFQARYGSLPLTLLGAFLSGIWFSLAGLFLAAKATSLNHFLLASVPVELFTFVPAILHLAGITPDWLRIYPANVWMDLIAGRPVSITGLFLSAVLIALTFAAAQRCTADMWQNLGGGTL